MPNNPEPAPVNISEKEADLIKRTFKGNEELLKSIRALFFGLPLADAEKQLIKTTFADNELRLIFSRRFLPFLDRNTPIGQVQDIWLGAEQMVFAQHRDAIYQAVHYKQASILMTRQALQLLEDPSKPAPNLDYDPRQYGEEALQVPLLARNMFIRHVEQQLLFIKLIAEQPAQKPDPKNRNSNE